MELHHIGYLVKDIDKATKAFKALGYNEISYVGEYVTDDEYRKCYICFLQSGSSIVELISPKDESSPIYGLMSKYKNTPYHLCFTSDDIDADIEHLKQEGYMIFLEPQTAPALEGKDVVFMMNRNIGIIELIDNK